MWTPSKIKELRKKYKETQQEFVERLGVAIDTLRHWEQGRGEPSGPASILLDRLDEDVRRVVLS